MHRKAAPLRSLRVALPLLAVLVPAGRAPAQFTDHTASAGLTWYESTWGAALADLDGDGFLDVYAGHHLHEPLIHWNEGDGTFSWNRYPQPWSGPTDRHGGLFVPLESAPRVDIFVSHGGAGGAGSEANELYRNDGPGTLLLLGGAGGMADPPGRTRCASAADYDGDLRVDIWVGKAPDAGSTSSLFRNDGRHDFSDVAAAAGLDETEGTVGGIWGDFDDDGDPDLFVGGEEFSRPSRLWRNDSGSFHDATSLFFPSLPVVSGADWGDLDGDGDLDLAVCNGHTGIFDVYAEGDSVSFFFNTRYGDTGLDGITVPATADTAYALLRVRAFPDGSLIFLGPNELNPPPGTVVMLTDQYVGEPRFDPGEDRGIFVWRVSAGGPWEIRCSTPNIGPDTFDGWITDGTPLSGVTPVLLEDPGFVPGGPKVWRNDGSSFVEVTSSLGLPAAMLNPRDISWVDYDNDGDLDLHVVDMGTSAAPNAPDALFRNDGTAFTDVTAIEGLAGGTEGMGDGGVWGDVDNDGDLDLYLAQGSGPATFSAFAPALFLENTGDRGASIQLDLFGRSPAVAAVGARVMAITPSLTVERRVAANSWRGFQDPMRLHLGLGEAASADWLIIEWPSGETDVYQDIPAGLYRIDEGVDVVGIGEVPIPVTAPPRGWRADGPRPQPARGPQTLLLSSEHSVDLVVSVYDVTGRLVDTLHRGLVPAGTTALSWSGRDRTGRRVAAGVYLVRVAEPGGRSVTLRSVRLD